MVCLSNLFLLEFGPRRRDPSILSPISSSLSAYLSGRVSYDQKFIFTLATQTLPAIQVPPSHFTAHFPASLTPPYHNDSKSERQWLGPRGQGGSDNTSPMSNKMNGGLHSGHSTPQMSPTQSYPAMQPPFRTSPRQGPVNAGVCLPPLRQLSRTPPTPSDRKHMAPFGVHSILNPQAELTEQQRNRRRSHSQMDSPSPIETSHAHSLPSISRPTSVDSTQEQQYPPRSFHPPERPPLRHILSPKSKKLHRTQSVGTFNPPTGTIDAHQTPFLTGSVRPSESIPLQPALPTPPPGSRTTYFPLQHTTAPTPPVNVVRSELRRPSLGFTQSGSASPITQYSPYSQAASVASSQYETQSTQGQYVPSSSIQAHGHASRHGSLPTEADRNSMIPMAPSSQSSIQLMTIKSQHGQVQIPVDVQAASKVADEKRRRNAGASARFRARRKEKEREASMSISRLEQQLRDAIEDAEFYRRERDYFKAVVFQQPQPERHYGRPSSPRLRRVSMAPSLAPSSTTGAGSEGSYGEYDDDDREEERNVRRRTSNYHPVAGSGASEPIPASIESQSYPPTYAPAGLPSALTTSTPNRQYSQEHLRHMAPPQPSSERPVFHGPYGSERSPYERATWNAGHDHGRPP